MAPPTNPAPTAQPQPGPRHSQPPRHAAQPRCTLYVDRPRGNDSGLEGTGWGDSRLPTKPELVQEARAEFAEATTKMTYFSVLPTDAKPPLDLNKETMDRYRGEMSKFYLNKPVRFDYK
jgi:hypothetical protein